MIEFIVDLFTEFAKDTLISINIVFKATND